MIPNPSGAVYGPTLGVSRNMEAAPQVEPSPSSDGRPSTPYAGVTPYAQGGGNLNGSANVANLLGQAGTAAQRIAVARRPMNSGNYCGVI